MQAPRTTIRRKREASGYSLTGFARKVGISPSWLSRIERDLAKPSPDVLKRIALTLHNERAVREAIAEIAQQEDEGSDDQPPDG